MKCIALHILKRKKVLCQPMCSDLGFRKHDPRNRRTLHPQVGQLLLMDSRSGDWAGGCENTLKRPFTIQMQAFTIIIIISPLLAIISGSEGIFSNANLITLCLSSKASHCSEDRSQRCTSLPGPAWPGSCLPHTGSLIPCAPTQAFSQLV